MRRRAAKLADVQRRLCRPALLTLDQINLGNMNALMPRAYQTMAGGKFETTPLVVDGVLYGTGQDDRAFAWMPRQAGRSAISARVAWRYSSVLRARESRTGDIGRQVFMGTLDSHVIALDGKTGNVCGTLRLSITRKATAHARAGW